MTTDLGVECMVGLCLAAAIWWIARRRRTHTEGPKTRLDPLGLAELEPLSATDDNTLKKDDLVVEGHSAQRNASGMPGKELPLSPSPQQQEHKLADDVDNESDQESEEDKEEDESWDVEDEDDAAEPDLTDDEDEDEDEEREEAADEDEEDEEENDEPRVVNAELDEVPLETLARVEALAAKMGVNMTESFMAMEEFLVLDAPPSPGALPSFETDRMRLEDHAVVPLSDAASDSEDEETDNNDDQPVDETKEEEQERRASHDNEQPLEDAAPDAEAAFWAKCENREECNLCHTPFTFLTRRHHCRKCFASVCGGCSANSAPLPEFGGRLERVCDTCWTSLQQKQVTPAADEETVTTEEAHEHEAS